MKLQTFIERQWYGKITWLWLLLPFNWLFVVLSWLNAVRQKRRAKKNTTKVPVVVVGNISVGGTGKTPVIISLVRYFQSLGFTPGVVSRGYGGSCEKLLAVTDDIRPEVSGDEPALIYQATKCRVAVAKDRALAVDYLIERGCSIIFSDDGMQHYQMHRDVEIALIDGLRGLGNGWRLPLGPLRESRRRLTKVDFIVTNINSPLESDTKSAEFGDLVFSMQARQWRNALTGQVKTLEKMSHQLVAEQPVFAVAGIGNPTRFFNTLDDLGLRFIECRFPDHYKYKPSDFVDYDQQLLVMTEKDAVKCSRFAQEHWWVLEVDAVLSQEFLDAINQKIMLCSNSASN